MLKNYGINSVSGNQIGSGLHIEHPVGIVIRKGVEIGKNVSIMGVTLGAKHGGKEYDGKYPKKFLMVSV